MRRSGHFASTLGRAALVFAFACDPGAAKAPAPRAIAASQQPLVAALETVLTAPGEPASLYLGGSVAVSADGAMALVSAAKTLVFERTGASWRATASLPAHGDVALTDDSSRAAVGGTVYVRSGSTWTQEAVLSPVSGVVLTPDGSRALVFDWSGASPPAIHVRSGTTWSLEATLTVPGLVAADRFGPAALSADGTRALVGAPGYSSGRGRAWVFARGAGGWSVEAELSGTGFEEQEFGASVSLSADGSRALVGEPLAVSSEKSLPCSVFVFNRSDANWTLETQISDTYSEGRFGNQVALSRDGTRAVIGAPSYWDIDVWRTGSVHFYVRGSTGTWTREAQFSEHGHDWLGSAVAITLDATRAIVGNALDDSASGPDTGSARSYVRAASEWIAEGDLVADGPSTGDRFGAAVAISDGGDRIVVGAPAAPTAFHSDGGRALSFVRSGSTWEYERHFPATGRPALGTSNWEQFPPVSRTPARFGAAVAVSASGDRVLVGEPASQDGILQTKGAVRVFERGASEWLEEAVLTVSASTQVVNGAGAAVALTADGTRALVGAGGEEGGASNGAISVYARTSGAWTEEVSLASPIKVGPRDGFGRVVALSDDGTRALASVDCDRSVGPPSYSGPPLVKVLARSGSTWSEEATLSVSQLVSAIAVNHDATIAAIGHQDGSIRLFSRAGTAWSDAGLLRPPVGSNERFDVSLAISSDGKRLLAGLPNDDTAAGVDAGSAKLYVNVGGTWTEAETLLARSAAAGDHFGVAVAMSRDGRYAVIGADASDAPVPDAGSVTVFALADCAKNDDCTSGYCVGGVCNPAPATDDAGSATEDDAGSATEDDAGSATEDDAGSATEDDAGSATEDDAGSATEDDAGSATEDDAGSATEDDDAGGASPDTGGDSDTAGMSTRKGQGGGCSVNGRREAPSSAFFMSILATLVATRARRRLCGSEPC